MKVSDDAVAYVGILVVLLGLVGIVLAHVLNLNVLWVIVGGSTMFGGAVIVALAFVIADIINKILGD